ncbi:RNA polymerase sigma-70 factor, ECF subfamily [Cyclobacterium xiamenense]|uniref:RNA polymerase sigma-70 factor, ECF subfamily n=1 Tax=Cyclobacterium xiamenense TaxID=1297121 RepID=A0A1H6ZSW1_9BACT|nr:RNA polymerase sigma-70 factor [Cyclobacterium xiamenense]SEJ51855.1 RNA polymerase sigma-70 factor, ECF subfamily [Cyclobacterium xiamenense]
MRPLIHQSEKELVRSLRQGDMKAFDELYHRFLPKLLGFAYKYLSDEMEAEETVQVIFIKIWEGRKSLDENKNFKAYLFQSVKNQLLNKLRNQKKNCTIEDIPEKYCVSTENVFEKLTYKELEDAATELIRNLPKTQQQVFVLNKIEGLSPNEIASRMCLSRRTVEHHIYLATKFLKGELMHKTSLYGPLLFLFL